MLRSLFHVNLCLKANYARRYPPKGMAPSRAGDAVPNIGMMSAFPVAAFDGIVADAERSSIL